MATEADIFAAHLALKKHPKRPKSYILSGIHGDSHHGFGYHLSPVQLPKSDYSLQKKRDRRGAKKYPRQASAWDLTFNTRDMKRVTERLLKAAKARDIRIVITVSEFCGTRNGRDTYPFDVTGNYCEGVNSWDDSHLWHVHISFLRDSTRAQVMGLVDVICGVPARKAPVKPTPVTPKPKPVITPKPAPGKASQKKHTPYPLKAGDYFGDIHGNAHSHGGFYKSERGNIAKIQRELIKANCVPGIKPSAAKKSSWVDGKFEGPTIAAVKRYQTKHKIPVTGRVDARTWKVMF